MTTATPNAPAVMAPNEIASFAIFGADIDVTAIRDAMQENLAGEDVSAFDLPRVKVPAGGGTTFSVPTIDGEQDMKELVGIIAFVQPGRSWWQVSMEESGGGSAPDCSSTDGLTGTKFGDCTACKYNQFGSARKGSGKDCKETRSVFLLQPDGALPTVISVPPTSLKPLKSYLMRLTSAGLPFSGVVTKITLNKAKNAGGITYAEMAFTTAGRLDAGQRQRIAAYAAALKESFVKAHAASVQTGAAYQAQEEAPMPEDNPWAGQGDYDAAE